MTPARIAITCALLGFLIGCGYLISPVSESIATFTGNTMGTTYSIRVAAKDLSANQRRTIQKAIASILDRIDREMSSWRDDSELSRFNASQTTTPVKVSPDLIAVLQCAQQVSEQSGGAFDVTVAPLVNAWGFGPRSETDQILQNSEIDRIKKSVGYQKLRIDAAADTLQKTVPTLTVDVAAIAPGFASDQLGKALEKLGYTNYIVELGGEVRARGHKPDGATWLVGIERPKAHERALYATVPLQDASLSTSGDYRAYFKRNGVRYSHTINPKTGRPVTGNLASVTVIHRDCMWADAYATAIEVLGPQDGYRFALKENLPTLLLLRIAPDVFQDKATPSYTALLQHNPESSAVKPGPIAKLHKP